MGKEEGGGGVRGSEVAGVIKRSHYSFMHSTLISTKKIVGDIFLLTKRVSHSLVLTTATSHLSKLTQRFPAEISPH